MTKNTKIAIGIGVGLLALYLIMKPTKVTETPKVNDTPAVGGCASMGLTKCPSSDKCYDPNMNYLVDPCLEIPHPVDVLPQIS